MTVEYSYTPDGQVATRTAKNSVTGDQVTTYEYDGLGRVVKEIYPDSENPLDDCVRFEYNRANEAIRKTDQNGTVHEYAYDNFGRLLADSITVLGTGVDGGVRKIGTEYNVIGNAEAITSYDEEDVVVNQILYQYDENGQLQREYTAHAGAVDPLTTPFIGYEHDSIENRGESVGRKGAG